MLRVYRGAVVCYSSCNHGNSAYRQRAKSLNRQLTHATRALRTVYAFYWSLWDVKFFVTERCPSQPACVVQYLVLKGTEVLLSSSQEVRQCECINMVLAFLYLAFFSETKFQGDVFGIYSWSCPTVVMSGGINCKSGALVSENITEFTCWMGLGPQQIKVTVTSSLNSIKVYLSIQTRMSSCLVS
jgi:hypothetical protein